MKLFSKTETETHNIYNIWGIKLSVPKKITKNDIVELKQSAFAASIIAHIHSKTFPKYRNINVGKNVAVVACGPSMKWYKPLSDTIHIGVNRSYQNEKIKFNYLFALDFGLGEKILDDITNYPANIFLGALLKKHPDSKIPIKYEYADNVNLYVSDSPRNLCYPYIEYCGLMDFGSVVFSAAQFALYTNPQRIYLVGCDCTGSGYFNGTKQNYKKPTWLDWPEGWEKFKTYQKTYYPDTEIISINPVGLKGMFKDVYTQNYLDEHPEINASEVEILKETV